MAAETFRIEIPIRVEDQTEPGVGSAQRKVNGFDKTVQKTQERLDKMNRTKYQVVLDALDRASNVVGKVSSTVRNFAGKTFSFTMKVLDVATAPLRGIWNMVTSIQGAILGATGAFAGFIKPMDIAGDFEQTEMAFTTMLGSAQKATKFLKEASDFANKTPFEFPELVNSSKLLLAFGFQADKVIDMMGTIGDTASGLGAGSDGIDRITRALGQMQAKGRVQAEEMLQLQELGVPAAQILQEELGLTAEQVANIGKEGVSSGKAIEALLKGMDKRFGGMMSNQSKTAKGMLSTIKDTLENTFLRNWGQGLWEGFKPGLEKITTWIDDNQETLEKWAEAWKETGANISKWVMSKVDTLRQRISDMVKSQEWKDAQTFGQKVAVAWDKIIAEPFSQWWNSTGKAWMADKAGEIGRGIGSGITTGLLALLGIDVSEATKDGKNVGGAFIQGFKDGFDTSKITDALKTWASENKEIVAGLGVVLGWKLLGGIRKVFKEGKSLYDDIKGIFGKGSKSGAPDTGGIKMPSTYTTTTMTVTASVVYITGPTVSSPNIPNTPVPNLPQLPSGGSLPQLPSASPTLALPGAASAAGKAYTVYAPTAAKGTSVVMGTTGSAVTAGLANTGYALGSGAATIGGAAAAGAAGITGIVGGAIGVGSGLYDIYQGTKSDDKKEAKDKYFSGGSKIGMVAAGAGIGAAVGSVVPVIGTGIGAAVGAGVGGVAALFGGDKAGKALSDGTDEGGGLAKFWEGTKKTASDAWSSIKSGASDAGSWVSEKWNSAGDWISDKWGGFSEWFDSSVWTPTKDVGISAINIAVGAWDSAKEGISEKWSEFSSWFDESVWTPVKDAAASAGQWVSDRWGEAKSWVGEKWSDFSGWFDSTVWEPVKGAAQTAGQWISDRWGEARTWVGERWSDFSGWFEESIWTPVKNGAQVAGAWIGDRWSEAKTFVSETWGNVSSWFSENVWEPVKGAAQVAGTWLGEKFTAAKDAIHGAWEGVSGWFEENVWGPIKSGASAAWEWVGEKLGGIGEWIGDKWTSFKDWLGDLGKKGSKSTGLTTSQGKGSVLEHAQGGIMTQPHMGIVAEDGPESIIPLEPGKRARGIDLWEQTGRNLGVMPYANGGIIGDTEEAETIPVGNTAGGTGGGNTFDIKVEVNPEFIIQSHEGMDEEGIVAIIKARIKEMVDDIGDELAERLARIFANTPVKGGA